MYSFHVNFDSHVKQGLKKFQSIQWLHQSSHNGCLHTQQHTPQWPPLQEQYVLLQKWKLLGDVHHLPKHLELHVQSNSSSPMSRDRMAPACGGRRNGQGDQMEPPALLLLWLAWWSISKPARRCNTLSWRWYHGHIRRLRLSWSYSRTLWVVCLILNRRVHKQGMTRVNEAWTVVGLYSNHGSSCDWQVYEGSEATSKLVQWKLMLPTRKCPGQTLVCTIKLLTNSTVGGPGP